MTGSYTLAFLAGVFSTLSPCVLPLLPVVVGASLSENKWAPLALALGLAASFVTIGLFFALFGASIGLSPSALRVLAGLLLTAAGLVMLVPALGERAAAALSPAGSWAENRFGGFETRGLKGQAALGLLLGAVWSPCVGPTLGAASVLAAQGTNLAEVAWVMALFGFGAGLPLALLGTLSREAMQSWRSRLAGAGRRGKAVLGALLLAVGALTLTGFDKRLETALVAASPEWLTELTTRY